MQSGGSARAAAAWTVLSLNAGHAISIGKGKPAAIGFDAREAGCPEIRICPFAVSARRSANLPWLAAAFAEGRGATPRACFILNGLLGLFPNDRWAAPAPGIGRPFIAPSGGADFSHAVAFDHHLVAAWPNAAPPRRHRRRIASLQGRQPVPAPSRTRRWRKSQKRSDSKVRELTSGACFFLAFDIRGQHLSPLFAQR